MRDWEDPTPGAEAPVVLASFPVSPQEVHAGKVSACFNVHPQNGNTHPARAALPAVLPTAWGMPGRLSWWGQTWRKRFG